LVLGLSRSPKAIVRCQSDVLLACSRSRCASALNVDVERLEIMHMEDTVYVDAPPEQVFDYVTDFRNTANWHENMRTVGFRTDEPPCLGSEYDWVESFMGKTMNLSGVITAWDRPN
jgi:uncharacterized membrane protein